MEVVVMPTVKATIMLSIALGLVLALAVSVAEAGRSGSGGSGGGGGGGLRGGGGGFRSAGGNIYIPQGGGGGFHGSEFRGGGGGYIMHGGGGASFQRGGRISIHNDGSYMRSGGMRYGSDWRAGRTIYGTSHHFGSYGGPVRRYAHNAWRGDNDRHRGRFGDGKRFRDHDFDRRHHRRFRRFVGYGFPYYDDYGYYAGGCGWLYRRALITRSPYWWNRYHACINYYY
jgi:hypothetical protein